VGQHGGTYHEISCSRDGIMLPPQSDHLCLALRPTSAQSGKRTQRESDNESFAPPCLLPNPGEIFLLNGAVRLELAPPCRGSQIHKTAGTANIRASCTRHHTVWVGVLGGKLRCGTSWIAVRLRRVFTLVSQTEAKSGSLRSNFRSTSVPFLLENDAVAVYCGQRILALGAGNTGMNIKGWRKDLFCCRGCAFHIRVPPCGVGISSRATTESRLESSTVQVGGAWTDCPCPPK
jgi:hypothetical protein